MTHEAGIKAAFNIFDNAGSQQDDTDIELAIQAYLSASGMALVPREPDELMLDAACDVLFDPSITTVQSEKRVGRSVYQRMLAAAPNPFKSKP